MGEAMHHIISAIWSMILVYWTDLLKLDEHRYHRDTSSGLPDTACREVGESAAEFSEMGKWALFWGGTGIRKRELQKMSGPSLPRRLPSLPRPVPSLRRPQLFRHDFTVDRKLGREPERNAVSGCQGENVAVIAWPPKSRLAERSRVVVNADES